MKKDMYAYLGVHTYIYIFAIAAIRCANTNADVQAESACFHKEYLFFVFFLAVAFTVVVTRCSNQALNCISITCVCITI